jgi:hypothetical protein
MMEKNHLKWVLPFARENEKERKHGKWHSNSSRVIAIRT